MPGVAFRSTIGGPAGLPIACEGKRSDAGPQIGVDPGRSDRLRSVFVVDGEVAMAGSASEDGGRTWQRAGIGSATRCSGGPAEREIVVNPLLAVGPGGRAVHGESWVGHRGGSFAFGIATPSWDGRGDWAGGDTVASDAQNAAVAADPKRAGRVYLLWTHLDQVPNPDTYAPTGADLRFAVSNDGGRSYGPARVVHEAEAGVVPVNSRLVIASDGTLAAIFDQTPLANLPKAVLGIPVDLEVLALHSADGGATWTKPEPIGTSAQFTIPDEEGGAPRGSAKPDLAAGPRGMLAAVWTEPAQNGRSTVELVTSRDAGRTWSAERRTVDVPGSLIQPAVAIAGDGSLGIWWYDFRHDVPGDATLDTDAWFAGSQNGVTWQELHLDGPFDLRATNRCTSPTPLSTSCEVPAHAMAIGIQQDLVGLPRGFGAAYTVGPPLARDGFTDARFARIDLPRRRARR